MTDSRTARPTITVAGVGATPPVLEDPRSIPEMVLTAVEDALADAGLGFDDIDSAVTASVDLFDGLTASNIAVTEVVGAVMKPETRIAADGLGAVVHAACQLWAGAYGTALVVAHGKASMAPYYELTGWALDPIYIQPLGVDFLTCAGLQANAIVNTDPDAEARWAAAAAARRAQAAPAGGVLPACTAQEVLRSPVVASPLRADMCAPLADSACAVVLSTTAGPTGNRRPVHLSGVGHDLAPHALGERDLASAGGLTRAAARAAESAGAASATADLDLCELSCHYAYEEELFRAALNISPETRVCPTGGLFAGAAPVAAGLSRFIAALQYVRAHPEARRALAHGTWGPAGQAHAVAMLEAA